MELVLYNTVDGDNVLNKDKIFMYRFNIRLKSDTDINSPVLTLNSKDMDFMKCNYCYLEDFERYYFIRNVENISNKVWRLHLECDVLESYKNDILNSYVELERKIKEGDYININNDYETRKTYEIYESDETVIGNRQIILSTVGGGD